MSSEFRLPLPGKLGPGMSATIPNFRPPKCSKFEEEKLVEISDRLMTLVQDEKTDTKLIEKKKTKQQIVEQQRLMSAIYPQTSTSKGYVLFERLEQGSFSNLFFDWFKVMEKKNFRIS
jgi:hypothetical protein